MPILLQRLCALTLFLILAPVARVGPLKAQRAPLNRPSSVERRVSSVTSTSAATSPATAPVLYPASPSQGDTLFVLVRGAGNVSCTWDGRSVPVARTGDASVATIGIRVDERTGSHNLVLKNTEADGTLHSEKRSVAVRRTAWPVQYLKMKRSTERLYTFPGAKAEDAAVTTATRTFSPTSLWRGAFLVPTNGRRSTPFGVKRIRNGRKPYYHRGVDLAAPTGTPVVAPNAGRVALARVFKKYGKTVVLDHGLGVTTLYLHMSALAVHEGETVQRGQLIGKVGMEGVATGPHLHWSLYVHGNSVSPLFWTRLPAAVLGLTR